MKTKRKVGKKFLGQDGISRSRLLRFLRGACLINMRKRLASPFTFPFSALGWDSVDDPITCDDSISRRIGKSQAALGLDAPVPNMGFSISAASYNRSSDCATRRWLSPIGP
jgi:hypothetical protein